MEEDTAEMKDVMREKEAKPKDGREKCQRRTIKTKEGGKV